MYKPLDSSQHTFLDFNQPIGLHMAPENRWVRMQTASHGMSLSKGMQGCLKAIPEIRQSRCSLPWAA